MPPSSRSRRLRLEGGTGLGAQKQPPRYCPIRKNNLLHTFSYAQRRELAEHAYQQTRQMLRSRKTGLTAKLARHGISLNHEALDDPKRHLSVPPKAITRVGRAIATLQEVMDDLSDAIAVTSRARLH